MNRIFLIIFLAGLLAGCTTSEKKSQFLLERKLCRGIYSVRIRNNVGNRRETRGKDIRLKLVTDKDGERRWRKVSQSYRIRCKFDLVDEASCLSIYRNSDTQAPLDTILLDRKYKVYFEGHFENGPIIENETERILVRIVDSKGKTIWQDVTLSKRLISKSYTSTKDNFQKNNKPQPTPKPKGTTEAK